MRSRFNVRFFITSRRFGKRPGAVEKQVRSNIGKVEVSEYIVHLFRKGNGIINNGSGCCTTNLTKSFDARRKILTAVTNWFRGFKFFEKEENRSQISQKVLCIYMCNSHYYCTLSGPEDTVLNLYPDTPQYS